MKANGVWLGIGSLESPRLPRPLGAGKPRLERRLEAVLQSKLDDPGITIG